jgi:hypothetical protein
MVANGTANGVAHAGLAPGHFLFTSESVGEGHPGVFITDLHIKKYLIKDFR